MRGGEHIVEPRPRAQRVAGRTQAGVLGPRRVRGHALILGLVSVALALIVSGCGVDLFPIRATQVQPQDSELVGQWCVTLAGVDAELNALAELTPPEIELRADHTARLRHFPGVDSDGDPFLAPSEIACRWHAVERSKNGFWGTPQPVWMLELVGADMPDFGEVEIRNDSAPRELVVVLPMDPDLTPWIYFERASDRGEHTAREDELALAFLAFLVLVCAAVVVAIVLIAALATLALCAFLALVAVVIAVAVLGVVVWTRRRGSRRASSQAPGV